jgi:hypothetical protein
VLESTDDRHSGGAVIDTSAYKPSDTGVNTSLMMLALQVVNQQGWIQPTAMSVSRDTHTFVMHNNLITVHVDLRLLGYTAQILLQRPQLGHLCINDIRNVEGDKAYLVTTTHIAAMARLHTLTIDNLGGGYYFKNMNNILNALPVNCTTLSLSRRCVQSDATVQWLAIPPHITVLTLRKVAWKLDTDTSQLEIVRLHDCDCDDMVLPKSVRELYMTKSLQLPKLNYGLRVLDLSLSRLTEDFVNTLPVTVTVLKLPKRYITTLPPKLEHLDVGYQFTQTVCKLPSTLVAFVMQRSDTVYPHSLAGKLPNGLQALAISTLTQSLSALPYCLQELHYMKCTAALETLPRTLRKLYIDGLKFNKPLGLLPATLSELHLGNAPAFRHKLEILPAALKMLKLHINYKQPLVGSAATTKVVRELPGAACYNATQRHRMILPRGVAVLTHAEAQHQRNLIEAERLAQLMTNLVAVRHEDIDYYDDE